ncbi:hypothetical protein MVEN_01849100 [Mycena venus]|uniref:DUF6533 domain-containing protein n=1 Tax=Mycena venus TaxID=2733690 RepID=A0A8H7CMW5_9AGAR|nr:hypothetical protein MVEN_01849100 [Mycena venus]
MAPLLCCLVQSKIKTRNRRADFITSELLYSLDMYDFGGDSRADFRVYWASLGALPCALNFKPTARRVLTYPTRIPQRQTSPIPHEIPAIYHSRLRDRSLGLYGWSVQAGINVRRSLRRIPVMSSTSAQIAGHLRVAAYAIALFDYLQSLPAEYRLYAKQKGPLKLSVACILFILVRYLGVIALVMGAVGYFYHGFSKEQCDKFYWMAPVFKLFLYLTSQVILAIRTYAVSRKSPTVLRILVVLFVLGEFISTFWKRIPFQSNGNCTGGNLPGVKVASLYYVGCLVFDAVAMSITAIYLWKFSNSSRASLSRLARMMLEDGIMYFIALTAMNIVNLIFFQSRDTTLQSSASSLGFAVTMIFSARFILNLSERTHDGVSGDNSHSSRTPASGGAPRT